VPHEAGKIAPPPNVDVFKQDHERPIGPCVHKDVAPEESLIAVTACVVLSAV
jgi:hypothetical protein